MQLPNQVCTDVFVVIMLPAASDVHVQLPPVCHGQGTLLVAATRAPAASSLLTTLTWPRIAARCSGVSPSCSNRCIRSNQIQEPSHLRSYSGHPITLHSRQVQQGAFCLQRYRIELRCRSSLRKLAEGICWILMAYGSGGTLHHNVLLRKRYLSVGKMPITFQ
jgi:hypothetical protein